MPTAQSREVKRMTVSTAHHKTITVIGMTCEHCVRAVHEELTAIDGVQGVQVDLTTGRVDIHSDRELTAAALAAAVDEAGYQIG
jgi:copper chaperone